MGVDEGKFAGLVQELKGSILPENEKRTSAANKGKVAGLEL